ncbi:MAG TPA: class I SAM-dependent methyltransferase [Burkholderiales bacterium]
MSHDLESPSDWVRRWAHLVRPGGRVLDLACGGGRHARFLAGLGLRVLGVDRDPAALAGVPGVELRVADLEGGPWPLGDERFDGVVVTNYLHRPLFPRLVDALAPGGVLIYETFALGNERYGRPGNPDFLLQPNELLERTRALRPVAFEQGVVARPKPAVVQRLCAVRESEWPPELEPR